MSDVVSKDPHSRCPRCGVTGAMYASNAFNAISRYRHRVFICSDCGRDEALNGDLPVWAIDTADFE